MGAGQEEGAEGPALGVELLRVVPQVQEDLLGDLLGRGGAAQDAPGQGVHGTSVAAVHLGQGLFVPSADGDHQVGVTRLRHVDHHGTVFGAGPDFG